MMEWREVTQWRRSQRERLIEQRIQAGHKQRTQWGESIHRQLKDWFTGRRLMTVGFYWPFKGEFDARPLIDELLAQGHSAALPAVTEPKTPMEFRCYKKGEALEPGIWKIPVPVRRDVVEPCVLIVPLVGFDSANYRLGYGGGYYDRTLAQLPDSTIALGVGYSHARLETIFPQRFDIPMTHIFTEETG
ncbi:MAG: 5-formyltetrahydrofolate cyclo-ligase [Pseudomonadales bacterium]|jgi:5-formyltetrahydrofolate cyclo-ligase